MAVDLSNYIDSLKREVNPPGTDDFPNATDDDWVGNLSDAFWEARLDGLLPTFTCDDNGLVTPINPTASDMGRDMTQLVILYASFRIIRNALRGLRTQFLVSAGSVRFEYQQSANLLTEILKDIINRRDIILMRLSDLGSSNVTVIDAIQARDDSMLQQITSWVAAGDLNPSSAGLYGLSGW